MTLYKFLKSGILFLEKKRIKNAKDDAMQIFLNAFNLNLSTYLQYKDMDMLIIDSNIKNWDSKINIFNTNLVKRVKHMPIQYILNEAYFYNIKLYVDENVLIPRNDTEVLVENVIKDNKDKKNIKLLDLCTGSGAIGISLAKNINIESLTFVDISNKALDIARRNAIENNVNSLNVYYIKSDMFKDIKSYFNNNNIDINKFDVITINPPYIETSVINTLDDEVKKYEPIIALDGGVDGLDFYKIIFENVMNYLSDKGKVYMEIGYNQACSIKELFNIYDYNNLNIIKDLANNDRVVTFTL